MTSKVKVVFFKKVFLLNCLYYEKKIKWHGFTNFDTRKKVFLHVVKMCLLESPIFNTKCSRFLSTFHRPFFCKMCTLISPMGFSEKNTTLMNKPGQFIGTVKFDNCMGDDIFFSVCIVCVSYWAQLFEFVLSCNHYIV